MVFLWLETANIEGWQRPLVITVLLFLLAWINVAGVKVGVRVSVTFAIAKIISILCFIGFGLFAIDYSPIRSFNLPDVKNIGEAALL